MKRNNFVTFQYKHIEIKAENCDETTAKEIIDHLLRERVFIYNVDKYRSSWHIGLRHKNKKYTLKVIDQIAEISYVCDAKDDSENDPYQNLPETSSQRTAREQPETEILILAPISFSGGPSITISIK